MPSQDTVLTSICVVVQRCEALYQSTAQIGPSMKELKEMQKGIRRISPCSVRMPVSSVSVGFFLLVCVIMVVIFVF